MTAPLLLPATWVVTVDDDPTERLASLVGGGLHVRMGMRGVVFYDSDSVTIVRCLIPEGTPADRVVVLLDEGGVIEVDSDGEVYSDGNWVCEEHELTPTGVAGLVTNAALGLARACAVAAFVAARAAEPTPDPLAQEWRVGEHYGIHVYRGDEPVATFATAEDAALAVADHNAALLATEEKP